MPPISASMSRIVERLTGFAEGIPVEALIAGARVVFDHSQSLCPVDTGFLKKSGFVQVQGNDVQIGYDADYASFVEFGTRKMEAQPFLRPAIDDNEEEILNEVGSVIEDFMVTKLNGTRNAVNTQQPPPGGTLQP